MNQKNKRPLPSSLKKQALDYHQKDPPGKINVVSSKKVETETDLSLAYSPGVAYACREIVQNPSSVYDYTCKGNLVAVISNGTSVLGLGNIGPLASKPVMEGKGILFKHFADINVFDIELNTKNVDEFVSVCQALEPTFGGINLEDISAPFCFEIEKKLKERLSIPVFHDDQHGTAIIVAAALINACKISGKELKNVQVVFSGAGAAAIACGQLIQSVGVQSKNIIMCDSKGVIYQGRKNNMNPYKELFSSSTKHRTLKEAIKGADVFIGLSQKDILTQEMIKTMAPKPIIFALANPDPEIHPAKAREVCEDAIIATGRSDFENQVNNVLGFPSIFRAALDVQARTINEEMKIAAAQALAELAREDVPESVSLAYGGVDFYFGKNYILPKPFDHRVVMTVAPAVAKAAMKSGVARKPIQNMEKYRLKLEAIQGPKKIFVRKILHQVKKFQEKNKVKPRIIFPEGMSKRVLEAINFTISEDVYTPILIGDQNEIKKLIKQMQLDHLDNVEIQNPSKHSEFQNYVSSYRELRKGKNISQEEATQNIKDPNYFASMSVHFNHAQSLITGARQNYVESIRPILQILKSHPSQLVSGMNIVLVKDQTFIFADTTLNIDPTAQQIAQIAFNSLELACLLQMEPRIAMISFTNFTGQEASPKKMKEAIEIFKTKHPEVVIDGEMQADTAVNPNIVKYIFPFSSMKKGANILIFPNLDSANTAYKLVQQLGHGEVIGPLLSGIEKPVNVVQRTGVVEDVIHTIIMTLLQIQSSQTSSTSD